MTKQDQLLDELRQLYRDGKLKELKRKYSLGFWILTEQQRRKIEKILGLEQRCLYDYAVNKLGYKPVDNSP